MAYVVVAILLLLAFPARATQYFFSPSGDDRASGTSPSTAWRTLARLGTQTLQDGDEVLLEAGFSYRGNIAIVRDRISVRSYGDGPAILDAGDGSGLEIWGSGSSVEDLIIVGSGRDANDGYGIHYNVGRTMLAGGRVHNVLVYGFGRHGLFVEGNDAAGVSDLLVEDSEFHDNRLSGITTFAGKDVSRRITIRRVRAYSNWGDPELYENSGSGIVLGGVDGGLIELSVAYDNGRLGRDRDNGAAGIWTFQSNAVLIRYNESYLNGTGGAADGDGFDLDGGTTNSVMEHNYSHDNDGAGFLLCSFWSAARFGGNVVRDNVSYNDARRNRYGSIHVFSEVNDTVISHNVVIVTRSQGGSPAGLDMTGWAGEGVTVEHNLFVTSGVPGARLAGDPSLIGNEWR